MQIVTLYGTRSAVASGKSLYRAEMSVGSLSYARDLLLVARENPLVSYPILDPWQWYINEGQACRENLGPIHLWMSLAIIIIKIIHYVRQ